jgi:hypothetical protein
MNSSGYISYLKHDTSGSKPYPQQKQSFMLKGLKNLQIQLPEEVSSGA